MKLHVLLMIGFALSVSGCGIKEQAATKQAAAPAVESMATESPMAKMNNYEYEGILRHMHSHADQLDLLNDALADDDFEAAKLPARWLWRHETMAGIPDDWHQYMATMRQAARDVESATELAAARAAATRIIESCQACHSAVGMDRDILEPQ
jgi:hypothetical protein